MNEGRIIEQGTHEQLLAKRGFYHELYASPVRGGARLGRLTSVHRRSDAPPRGIAGGVLLSADSASAHRTFVGFRRPGAVTHPPMDCPAALGRRVRHRRGTPTVTIRPPTRLPHLRRLGAAATGLLLAGALVRAAALRRPPASRRSRSPTPSRTNEDTPDTGNVLDNDFNFNTSAMTVSAFTPVNPTFGVLVDRRERRATRSRRRANWHGTTSTTYTAAQRPGQRQRDDPHHRQLRERRPGRQRRHHPGRSRTRRPATSRRSSAPTTRTSTATRSRSRPSPARRVARRPAPAAAPRSRSRPARTCAATAPAASTTRSATATAARTPGT